MFAAIQAAFRTVCQLLLEDRPPVRNLVGERKTTARKMNVMRNSKACERTLRIAKEVLRLMFWLLIVVSAVVFAGCGKSDQQTVALVKTEEATELKPVDIDYASLDFAKLNETQAGAIETAQGLKGDEAEIMRAWASALKDLSKARSEVERTGKVLTQSDILNISTITNGSRDEISDQFVERRKIANANWSAINDWQNAVYGLSRAYLTGLAEHSVDRERAQNEVKKMRQALVDKAKAEADSWEGEKKVAQQYNYAVNAMQDYYTSRMARVPNTAQPSGTYSVPIRQLPWEVKNTPDPLVSESARRFDRQVAEVEQLKKAAQALRQQTTTAN